MNDMKSTYFYIFKFSIIFSSFLTFSIFDVSAQEFEMGLSPFYANETSNLNRNVGGEFFVNFIKTRPMVWSINIGGYNATTNNIHSGVLKEFNDDVMIKYIDFSIQYNRKTAYAGIGLGYYITNYKLGEDISKFSNENDLLTSIDITNEFGINVKAGVNLYISENSFIKLEIKHYEIEPTLTFTVTDLNALYSLSKENSGSFGTTLIIFGYGYVF